MAEAIFLAPGIAYRAIGPEVSGGGSGGLVITADVTETEEGHDELFVTENPVETGAPVADHAYKRPPELILRVGFSNSSQQAAGDPTYASGTYNTLLMMQADRWPMTVYTGKRVWPNMLLVAITQRTDQASEWALVDLELRFRNVILVNTQQFSVTSNPSNQANPESTQPTQNAGAKNLVPPTSLNQSAQLPPPFYSGDPLGAPTSGIYQVPLNTPASPTPVL